MPTFTHGFAFLTPVVQPLDEPVDRVAPPVVAASLPPAFWYAVPGVVVREGDRLRRRRPSPGTGRSSRRCGRHRRRTGSPRRGSTASVCGLHVRVRRVQPVSACRTAWRGPGRVLTRCGRPGPATWPTGPGAVRVEPGVQLEPAGVGLVRRRTRAGRSPGSLPSVAGQVLGPRLQLRLVQGVGHRPDLEDDGVQLQRDGTGRGWRRSSACLRRRPGGPASTASRCSRRSRPRRRGTRGGTGGGSAARAGTAIAGSSRHRRMRRDMGAPGRNPCK